MIRVYTKRKNGKLIYQETVPSYREVETFQKQNPTLIVVTRGEG